jgi:hypothetical protein
VSETYLVEFFGGGVHWEDKEARTPEERDAIVAAYTERALDEEEGYHDIYVLTIRDGKVVAREPVDLTEALYEWGVRSVGEE